MSRPSIASNVCEQCGREEAVAWMLENEEGELEALVIRCMWCFKWDFTDYTFEPDEFQVDFIPDEE